MSLLPRSYLIYSVAMWLHVLTYLSIHLSDTHPPTAPLTHSSIDLRSCKPHASSSANHTLFSVLCKLFFQVHFAVYLDTYIMCVYVQTYLILWREGAGSLVLLIYETLVAVISTDLYVYLDITRQS